jgi:hypothetical protein
VLLLGASVLALALVAPACSKGGDNASSGSTGSTGTTTVSTSGTTAGTTAASATSVPATVAPGTTSGGTTPGAPTTSASGSATTSTTGSTLPNTPDEAAFCSRYREISAQMKSVDPSTPSGYAQTKAAIDELLDLAPPAIRDDVTTVSQEFSKHTTMDSSFGNDEDFKAASDRLSSWTDSHCGKTGD